MIHAGRKTVHAVAWNYASFALSKGVVLITMAVLTRLLPPETFGIVSLATIIISYFSLLQDLGLGSALIQQRNDVQEAANTVYAANLVIGILFFLFTFAIAPAVAVFFRAPAVEPMLRILALTFLIDPFGSVHIALLQRDLAFRKKLIPDLGRLLIKAVVTIVLAVKGFGAWSLIIGQLSSSLSGVILARIALRQKLRMRIKKPQLGRLLKFSIPFMAFNLINALVSNIEFIVIGRTLGDAALGIYSITYRIVDLLIMNVWVVLAGAMFPALATIQHQPHLLRRAFLSVTQYVQVFIVPISLGLIITAEPIVKVLLGAQWLGAIPILRLLPVAFLIFSIGTTAGDIYKAIGRPALLLKMGILHIIILIPLLLVGVQYQLVGVALSLIATAFLVKIVHLFVIVRVIGVTVSELMRALRPAFVGGTALTIVTTPLVYSIGDQPPVVQLLVAGVTGAAAYFGTLWLLEKEVVIKGANTILDAVRR
ncbi:MULTISPECIES: lipopolysaccharide biosynthesis protein [Methylocaldum]|jgi:O-antigen/teichoic acid export membrane protein|uniref:lipopolysaccharide biosynthesis protein n=1 Tax=unclassified Methylocaldum TaxID=2622260 RepID=UPI00098A8977|nr:MULTISPECIES: lipopolysaccharide biosynthesis protein [unclassified Methylocaldum]MVF23820.1 lipopolysaccharide biosynthesis protein [Methylocaldum sp. BRCS4]